MKIDWLIVGAGFSGCILAERIASQLGQTVLIVEQRSHIGGNAYDDYDEHGILIHHYGPHIFHTNAHYIWDYLSQFTQWRIYHHQVLALVEGKPIPIPFNFNSLYQLFPTRYADKLTHQLIQHYGLNTKIPILKILETAPTPDLKFLANYIYQNLFHHYTLKQWGIKPEALSPGVTARVPIHLSRDNRYFQDQYQGLPKLGYTKLFNNLIKHPAIKLLLNTPYQELIGQIDYRHLIFTGPIDEYFSYQFGELPYRSLHFNFIHTPDHQHQPVATLNYPNDYQFTRITEFKHLTGQQMQGSTYVEEYPQTYQPGHNLPYYPIPQEETRELYRKYANLAESLKHQILFAGRLGDYQYYNMDQAVARALTLFKTVICQN